MGRHVFGHVYAHVYTREVRSRCRRVVFTGTRYVYARGINRRNFESAPWIDAPARRGSVLLMDAALIHERGSLVFFGPEHADGERRGLDLRALSDATLRFDLAVGVRRRRAPKMSRCHGCTHQLPAVFPSPAALLFLVQTKMFAHRITLSDPN